MFYQFHQNNSGGGFEFDDKDGITTTVIIEADSANEANAKLESIGGYFEGTFNDVDCPTCGDRWYPVVDSDGADVPNHYGRALDLSMEQRDFHGYGITKWQGPDNPEFYVHYKDGRVVGCNS